MIKFFKILIIIFIIITFGLGFKFVYSLYSADVLAEKGSELFDDGSYEQALHFYSKAINKNPLEPRYFTGRAKIYIALTAGETESNIRTYKLLALEDLRRAYSLNPNNLLTVKGTISLYYFLATKDLTLPAGADNVDLEFMEVTETFYRNIWNASPNDVGVYVLLYTYSNRLGLTDTATNARNRIEELRPDLLEWFNFR